ncbi:MAG: hypothetical protein GY906_24490 [bacterium]|nr:hypothetical protein [bacterium]
MNIYDPMREAMAVGRFITPWLHLNLLLFNADSDQDVENWGAETDAGHDGNHIQQLLRIAANQFLDLQDLDHDQWGFPSLDQDVYIIEDTR